MVYLINSYTVVYTAKQKLFKQFTTVCFNTYVS